MCSLLLGVDGESYWKSFLLLFVTVSSCAVRRGAEVWIKSARDGVNDKILTHLYIYMFLYISTHIYIRNIHFPARDPPVERGRRVRTDCLTTVADNNFLLFEKR